MWYYIMLHQAGDAYKEAFCLQFDKDPTLRLSDWGNIYWSQVRERICWRRLKTKSMIGPQLCTNVCVCLCSMYMNRLACMVQCNTCHQSPLTNHRIMDLRAMLQILHTIARIGVVYCSVFLQGSCPISHDIGLHGTKMVVYVALLEYCNCVCSRNILLDG